MYTAANVANNILFRSKCNITPMKLQKMLYIIYKEYLSITGKKLFNEPFEAWRYGPVVRCVYDEFKSFGSSTIDEFAKDAEGNAYMVSEEYDQDLQIIIDDVFRRYKATSGVELSRLTHINEKSAWKKAIENHRSILKDADIREEKSYLR